MALDVTRDGAGEEPGEHGLPSPQQARLGRAVADVYADLRLAPVLQSLLAHSRSVARTRAGSVSVVAAASGTYVKVAEEGIPCQLGRAFPLDQGATGQAYARRRPVVIDDYASLAGGHLPPDHPARHGAAVAVPLWWRGEVIGVNVAFAGEPRAFAAREVDALEVLTQTAAGALVSAGEADPSLARLLREHAAAALDLPPTVVTEVGVARPVAPAVAATVVDLVGRAGQAAARRSGTRLHVAVVYRPDGLRLLVQDEAAPGSAAGVEPLDPLGLGARTWGELLPLAGGALSVERVPGWGTLVRADLPYAEQQPVTARAGDAGSGRLPPRLTPREREVLRLLVQGMSDREISDALVVSRKTVEKHVGAVLRKTATASRTAAAVTALERGWVDGAG
jgi:DNA-binding CsgD family transcriptional regulator